jgi:hypothetical protein
MQAPAKSPRPKRIQMATISLLIAICLLTGSFVPALLIGAGFAAASALRYWVLAARPNPGGGIRRGPHRCRKLGWASAHRPK